MKKNHGKAAFALPYFSETESRQIGETPDKRTVWQSDSGPPFLCLFDAKGRRSLSEVTPDEFTAWPAPHKTFAEMTRNAETSGAPVGTVRGPFTVGWGNDPRGGVSFMVRGSGGWVPFSRPRAEVKDCGDSAREYAFKLLSEPTP